MNTPLSEVCTTNARVQATSARLAGQLHHTFSLRHAAVVHGRWHGLGTGAGAAKQVNFARERDMMLVWATRQVTDFYALDVLRAPAVRALRPRIFLAAEKMQSVHAESQAIHFVEGSVLEPSFDG